MMQALYTAANGMTAQQKNIDVIGANVANVNTDGYKKMRTDFKDALYLRMVSPVDNSLEKNLQRGAGVLPYQIRSVFLQGAFTETGRALDFALDGEGFFTLQGVDEDEQPLYTRSGSFYISPEDRALVTAQGYYVLDEDGAVIELPEDADLSGLRVAEDGTLSLFDSETGETEPFARLAVVNFTNPPGLEKTEHGYFRETENSGDMEEADAAVLQGRMEKSNVDFSEEITRLIRAQRAYQLASRCAQTADQMQQTCNSIRS